MTLWKDMYDIVAFGYCLALVWSVAVVCVVFTERKGEDG
jgi:hypothetical protein